MAIAFRAFASGVDNLTTGVSLTINLTINIGDCLVVHVGRPATTPIGNVTDDGGNTYTQQNVYSANAPGIAIFTTIATVGASVITCNYTAGTRVTAVVGAYTGVASIGSNTNTHRIGSGTLAVINCTLADSDNWAVAGMTVENIAVVIANTGNLRGKISGSAGTGMQSALVDNSGALTVVCSVNYTNSASTCAFVELVAPPAFENPLDDGGYIPPVVGDPNTTISVW